MKASDGLVDDSHTFLGKNGHSSQVDMPQQQDNEHKQHEADGQQHKQKTSRKSM